MSSSPENVTQLLVEYRNGDREALDRLIPMVYKELRRMAGRYLKGERQHHTLEPTALVNEAYLKMVDQHDVQWQNRAHFLGCAAQIMRHILVDSARAHRAEKRGGGDARVTLSEDLMAANERNVDLILLEDALHELEAMSPEQARVVELKFFGGLSIEETAEVLGLSTATVRRDWTVARAWLRRALRKGDTQE